MLIPMPDTATVTRPTWADDGTYTAPADVYTEMPCMILQEGESTEWQIPGSFDESKIVMIADPDYELEMGDLITDEDTDDVYVITEPPSRHRDPTTFGADTPMWHHQEVLMERYAGPSA